MENDKYNENSGLHEEAGPHPDILVAEYVPEELTADMLVSPPVRRRRVWLPLGLFVGTCVSTWFVGGILFDGEGWKYALAIMTILVCHEMGHFVQACRYGVYSSWPFFIPIPAPPFGTFGAVISLGSQIGNRRALFDIGASGPLAGLVPTIIFCVVGVSQAAVTQQASHPFIQPLLFTMLTSWFHGPIQAGYGIEPNPFLYAGWVGVFITALNLIPIGQLDGGHVLYALLRKKAHWVATILLTGAVVIVFLQFKLLGNWLVMLFLLTMMGPRHPPTADDEMPLGTWRTILGWLTLLFLLIGFTPTPMFE
jgi:membrane-associated protease RseP (regulator of RpoE activity)